MAHTSHFSQKAVNVTNLFREALGLLLIKSGSDDGKVTILPFIRVNQDIIFDGSSIACANMP